MPNGAPASQLRLKGNCCMLLRVKTSDGIPKCTVWSVQHVTKPRICSECTKPLSLGAYKKGHLSVSAPMPLLQIESKYYRMVHHNESPLCFAANVSGGRVRGMGRRRALGSTGRRNRFAFLRRYSRIMQKQLLKQPYMF